MKLGRLTMLWSLWCALAACPIALEAVPFATANLVGNPLREVLRDLRKSGVPILFSTELVSSGMIIETAPRSADLEPFLEELLAPHGLTLRSGPGGILSVIRARARPVQLRGEVRAEDSGVRLPGVELRLHHLRQDLQVLTDEAGGFELSALEPGSYSLEARHPGYVASALELQLEPGESRRVDLRMRAMAMEYEEIVVTPSYYSVLREGPPSQQSLSRDEVRRLPHLGDDPLRAIAWLPGSSSTDSSAELNIRGGVQDEVLLLIDGLEIQRPFYFRDASIFSVIDAEAVSGLDYMTGGYPVQYGDRMSGVIDITSRTATSRARFGLGLSLTNFRFQTSGPFADQQGDWFVSGRRGFLEPILALTLPNEDFPTTAFLDILGKVGYNLGPSRRLSFQLFGAYDDLVQNGDGERTHLAHGNQYAWLDLASSLTPRLYAQTILFVGRLERDRNAREFRGTPAARLILGPSAEVEDTRVVDSIGLKQDWGYDLSSRHSLKWGIDLRQLEGTYDFRSSALVNYPFFADLLFGFSEAQQVTKRVEITRSGYDNAAYIADTMRLLSSLNLELGLRFDDQTYTEDSPQLSPRFNLSYSLPSRTTLRAAWGHFHQSQRLHELQVGDGLEHFFPAQRSEHRILSLEHTLEKADSFWSPLLDDLDLRVEVYQKKISDVRPRYENLLDPTEILSEVIPDRHLVAPDRAEARGLELLFKQGRRSRLNWWLSYALAWAEDEIDGEWVPRKWDQRHTASASINYHLGQRWNINVAALYHSGWPFTPVSLSAGLDDDSSLVIEPLVGSYNSERLPDYYRLDFRVSRFWDLSSLGRVTFFFDVANLLNHENVCCRLRPRLTFGEEGRPEIDFTAGGLPILPSFGVTWEF